MRLTATAAVAAAASAGAAGSATAVPRPAVPETGRTSMLYSVSAHADDELAGWSFIDDRPDTYTVFVVMTRGESTISCETLDEATPPPSGTDVGGVIVPVKPSDVNWVDGIVGNGATWSGPHRYQGPDSPSGQPDQGERHPLGYPWVGNGTEACGDARVASWHWYLDEAASLDNGLPSFEVGGEPELDDDFAGRFCDRRAKPNREFVLCADVWRDADGARVMFNAPDSIDPANGEATKRHTVAALQLLRANRTAWGLPALPEAGVLANAYHSNGEHPECERYPHPQHAAVQDAVHGHEFGAAPRFGVAACARDPRLEGATAEVHPWKAKTFTDIQWVDPVTEERVGPYNKNYGWLFETYSFTEGKSLFWRK